MKLESTSIRPGAPIDLRFAEISAGGKNIAPHLVWSDFPADTKAFAVLCFDPDAPTGSGWWHWIGYGIPADRTSLNEGEDFPGYVHVNDYGYDGYGGPCPPPGPAHRYQFSVYALDEAGDLGITNQLTSAAARFMILSHALDHATLEATFALPDDQTL